MTHRPSQRYAHAHGACVSEQRVWKSVGNQRLRKGGRKCRTSFKEAKGGERRFRRSQAISPLNHRIRLKGGVEALESNYSRKEREPPKAL